MHDRRILNEILLKDGLMMYEIVGKLLCISFFVIIGKYIIVVSAVTKLVSSNQVLLFH